MNNPPVWVRRAAVPVTVSEVGRLVSDKSYSGPERAALALQSARDAVQADRSAVAEVAGGADVGSLVVRGVVAYDRERSAVFLPLGRGKSGRRKRSLLDAGGRPAPLYRVRVYTFKVAPDLGAEVGDAS